DGRQASKVHARYKMMVDKINFTAAKGTKRKSQSAAIIDELRVKKKDLGDITDIQQI
ncbi:hypothetical protein ABVT39_008745, partial [Epinephelus coioides]